MLICPHCDKSLDERHQRNGCKQRFTRRFLFGLLAGASTAAALPDVWLDDLIVREGDRVSVSFDTSALDMTKRHGHILLVLTPQKGTREKKYVDILHNYLDPAERTIFIAPESYRIDKAVAYGYTQFATVTSKLKIRRT